MNSILKGLALDEVTRSIIMVAGVGGAGGNALNHMVELGINDVTFMACNTDAQALERSKAPIKVQLGGGLGAGNDPEIGSQAAKESIDDIINVLRSEGTRMIFITAGMGGGTGTGASPVVAKAAQELGVLTVAIVTTPFTDEGQIRNQQAKIGIEELRQYTDSLLVLSNDSIEEQYGDLPYDEGFGKADDVLATAVKGIAEIITGHGKVNVDFADVNKVMKSSGRAFMGSGRASGENRAEEAVKVAVTSLLLNYSDIVGAKNILLNISHGKNTVTGNEAKFIRQDLQGRTGWTANLIWGTAYKPQLGDDEIELTIVATGFPGDVDEVVPVPAPRPETATSHSASGFSSAHHTSHPERRTGYDRPSGFDRPAFERQNFDRPGFDRQPIAREPRPIQQRTPPPQSGTVQWKGTDRYANIEKLVNTPAWVRRKAELDRHDVRPAGKAALEKDDSPQPTTGSLFE
jgi:cell division protein FtsZ